MYHVGQGGHEREGMCLGLVRKLAKDSEGNGVEGVLQGSLHSAAISGGTWDGEDWIGVKVWTYLGLGLTAVRLVFGLNQRFLRWP